MILDDIHLIPLLVYFNRVFLEETKKNGKSGWNK